VEKGVLEIKGIVVIGSKHKEKREREDNSRKD